MTLTEKLLARAGGRAHVEPGENIWVNNDVLLTHDVCGPGTIGVFKREFGKEARVWDPSKIVIIPDHYIFTADSRSNAISTSGDTVHGVVAISEAGDGGTGGEGHGPDEGVGGNGGHGGTAGEITVTFAGDITTLGDKAQGVFLQSIGGAGGVGGDGDSWFDGNGGLASVPGPGGEASLSYANGTIITKGNEASGILVESVGGFAGSSGRASGFVGYGANGASAGDGNTVKATLSAVAVETTGHYSAGLSALSVGGGGGVGSK